MPSPPTPPRRRNGPQRAGAPERSDPHLRAEGDVASPRPPCALPARPARPDIPLGSETLQGPAPAAGCLVPCLAARAGQCCSDPRRGQAGLVTAAPPGDWAYPRPLLVEHADLMADSRTRSLPTVEVPNCREGVITLTLVGRAVRYVSPLLCLAGPAAACVPNLAPPHHQRYCFKETRQAVSKTHMEK